MSTQRATARGEASAARLRRDAEGTVEARREAPFEAIAALQRTAGNAAVEAALRSAGVRLHADAGAKEVLRGRRALALARGRDVYISPTLDLAGERGREVLAHELAHVAQQTRPEQGTPPAALEAEAQAIGAGAEVEVAAGASFGVTQTLLFDDTEEEAAREREARDSHARELAERRGVLKSTAAWKDYVDHPIIGPWLKQHPDALDPLGRNTEFREWIRDPQKHRPAPASPPRSEAPQPAPAAVAAPVTAVLPAASDLQVEFDQASGRQIISYRGTPVAAIEAPKGAQLNVDVVASGDDVRLNVTGGPHRVVPLGARAGAHPEATVPVYSEDTPPPAAKSLEQVARESWERSTSPRQKWEAALRGPPERYIGSLERSLLQFESGMRMVPGVRAGVSFGHALWGEDILNRPVSRSAAALQGVTEFGEDLSMILGPEDLMELGSGRAGAALGEGATMTSEVGAAGGREGLTAKPLRGEPPSRVAHADLERVTYTDVKSPATTKGNVSSPKYRPEPPKPASAPAPTKKQLRSLSLNEGYTARPKGLSADLDPVAAQVKEQGLTKQSWKQQGREFRSDVLETFQYDKNQPAHVRGWLENEQRRLAFREAEGGAARQSTLSPAERRRRLDLGKNPEKVRNPPGYVLGHGSGTPAREGFDYTNSTLTTADLNELEELTSRKFRRRR
jgi:hypothetical protein